GPFSKIEDIQNITGIGQATFDKIKADITVDGSTTLPITGSDSTTNNNSSGTIDVVYEEKKVLKPVGGLVISAPDHAFVDQVIQFNVEPLDGTNGRLVRYVWNFGDGHTANTKDPRHSYRYPGTYVVVVESYYLKSI